MDKELLELIANLKIESTSAVWVVVAMASAKVITSAIGLVAVVIVSRVIAAAFGDLKAIIKNKP